MCYVEIKIDFLILSYKQRLNMLKLLVSSSLVYDLLAAIYISI